jgi:hypothetical protein
MPNRRGRPRVDPTDRPAEVCLTLPAKQYDVLYTKARAEGVSIPEIIRRELARRERLRIGKSQVSDDTEVGITGHARRGRLLSPPNGETPR